MGLLNGNQAVIPTCLGELTDRSNQSRAFTYLPVIYGIGSITGPIVGGLLVSSRKSSDGMQPNPYPYLPPNLLSAALLTVDLILTMIFLEESLEEAHDLPPIGERLGQFSAGSGNLRSQNGQPTFDGNILSSIPIPKETAQSTRVITKETPVQKQHRKYLYQRFFPNKTPV